MSDTVNENVCAEKMALDHWKYVAGVMRNHGEAQDVIDKCQYHYVTAFVHGWKHAQEEKR